jgi:hypothetical protein
MSFVEAFDGIWACASLIHIPKGDIEDVLARFTRALSPGAVWYLSLKIGDGEVVEGCWFFSRYGEAALRSLLASQRGSTVIDIRDTKCSEEKWTNVLVNKVTGRYNRPCQPQDQGADS